MPIQHQQHQPQHIYPQQGYNNHQNQMRGQNNMIPQQRYMHPNPNYYSGFVPPPPPPPGQYHPPHE